MSTVNGYPKEGLYLAASIGGLLVLIGGLALAGCMSSRSKMKRDQMDYEMYLKSAPKEKAPDEQKYSQEPQYLDEGHREEFGPIGHEPDHISLASGGPSGLGGHAGMHPLDGPPRNSPTPPVGMVPGGYMSQSQQQHGPGASMAQNAAPLRQASPPNNYGQAPQSYSRSQQPPQPQPVQVAQPQLAQQQRRPTYGPGPGQPPQQQGYDPRQQGRYDQNRYDRR
ncbi:hypothetical protein BJ742DRAFT_373361 [Cladochytrium replicatum]|nr:hypothetical protein BJ742DRAFT_373361 [Cladochytrium replicatum]